MTDVPQNSRTEISIIPDNKRDSLWIWTAQWGASYVSNINWIITTHQAQISYENITKIKIL